MNPKPNSFSKFIYPFIFDKNNFKNRIEIINSLSIYIRDDESLIWEKVSFPKEDLMPHVAKYLNPEKNEEEPTAIIWKMRADVLQSHKGYGSSLEWNLIRRNICIPFELKCVELILFRVGIGFILFDIEPKEKTDFNVWLDFLHYFRFINGYRDVKILIERKVGSNEKEKFFPEPAGGVSKHPNGEGLFREIIDSILLSCSVNSDQNKWWVDVFIPDQLIPYAALLFESAEENMIPTTIYKVRNFFHSKQTIIPSDEDLSPFHESLLQYTRNQWFLFSLEGSTFVAFNPPENEFFNNTLISHLKEKYLLLYLIVLHQRFCLMKLSAAVSEKWLIGNESKKCQSFQTIQNDLLEFTARGYFTQVMQSAHHHRYYRKWHEIFQLDKLYQEVYDEVQDMHNYLQLQRTQKIENKLNFIAWILGIPAIALAFLDAIGPVSFELAMIVGASALCLGIIVFFIINMHIDKTKS